MRREMSVAGTFYPQRVIDLNRYFDHFNKICDENAAVPDIKSKAVIVPHAGYIYSGFTANIAYRILEKSNVKRLVVIGPSHRVAFEGVSMCQDDSYDTPFGEIKSSTELVKELKDKFNLITLIPHAEHSTEVQFPFIKHYLRDVEIVELVYGRADSGFISEIIDYVLAKEGTGVVISTDLSHFYTLQEANKLDNICLESINNLDIEMLERGCEACGKIGVDAMLKSAKKLGLNSTLLDYRTSADASDDTSRVVGYLSACFD